jgi:hypothetical protein
MEEDGPPCKIETVFQAAFFPERAEEKSVEGRNI